MRVFLLGLLAALGCWAQNPGNWTFTTINPNGQACTATQAWVYMPSGALYSCQNGTAAAAGGGGGSGCTVAGGANVLQKNNGSGGCAASSLTDNNTTLISTDTGFSLGSSPPVPTWGTASGIVSSWGTDPTGLASAGFLTPNSSDSHWHYNVNNVGAFIIPGVASAGTLNHLVVFDTGGINLKDGGAVPTVTGGTCTNQVVTAISGSAVPTCTTITSAYVNNSIALTGVDINTSNQVTATHLAAALPIAQGGTNCTSASITCFNNITGFSAAGTTGTTSTNLVFSTNPTFATDIITPAVFDSNGNVMLAFTTTATAVDGFTFTNAATAGHVVSLAATGGDTNISMSLLKKGTGVVTLGASPYTVDPTNKQLNLDFGGTAPSINFLGGGGGINAGPCLYSNRDRVCFVSAPALSVGSDMFIGWSSSITASAATFDTAFFRTSQGLIEVNNAASCATASNCRDLKLRHSIASGTAPTIASGGGGTGSAINGTSADESGSLIVGTSISTNSVVLTFGTAFPYAGPNCDGTDQTNSATIVVVCTTAPYSGVGSGTYTSGISATGSSTQTCTLTITGGGGTGATATVALTGTNTIAGGTALVITGAGSAFSSAPTAATASNGTATCSGTATIATVLSTTGLALSGYSRTTGLAANYTASDQVTWSIPWAH